MAVYWSDPSLTGRAMEYRAVFGRRGSTNQSGDCGVVENVGQEDRLSIFDDDFCAFVPTAAHCPVPPSSAVATLFQSVFGFFLLRLRALADNKIQGCHQFVFMTDQTLSKYLAETMEYFCLFTPLRVFSLVRLFGIFVSFLLLFLLFCFLSRSFASPERKKGSK